MAAGRAASAGSFTRNMEAGGAGRHVPAKSQKFNNPAMGGNPSHTHSSESTLADSSFGRLNAGEPDFPASRWWAGDKRPPSRPWSGHSLPSRRCCSFCRHRHPPMTIADPDDPRTPSSRRCAKAVQPIKPKRLPLAHHPPAIENLLVGWTTHFPRWPVRASSPFRNSKRQVAHPRVLPFPQTRGRRWLASWAATVGDQGAFERTERWFDERASPGDSWITAHAIHSTLVA